MKNYRNGLYSQYSYFDGKKEQKDKENQESDKNNSNAIESNSNISLAFEKKREQIEKFFASDNRREE